MNIGELEIYSKSEFEAYAKMDRAMQAFTFGQLQTTLTVATWMGHLGISFADLAHYVGMFPSMQEAIRIGYFRNTYDVKHAEMVRAFEKNLKKDVRVLMRKVRLKYMNTGALKKG